jgi:exodeoxyribonuclease V beta subunit
VDTNNTLSEYYKKSVNHPDLQVKVRSRSLFTLWQMSSYTALSALSLHDAPELPEDKAREQATVSIADEPQPEQPQSDQLPRGADTGNVVHYLLENCDFGELAEGLDISVPREKACLRYGLKLEHPALLDELLKAVVSTPLSVNSTDFCLRNLGSENLIKEMPFYLSLKAIDTLEINPVLQNSPVYQALSSKQMLGFLTGFIDLVCKFENLYYVIDYKTNALPNYQPATIIQSMRDHNYGLQYWIYTVVLHRYLQMRVKAYDYEKHFGGVRYLYVRGMQPDIAMSGVYQDRPELATVEALAALFA